MRLLLVGDEDVLRIPLADDIREAGYEVTAFASPLEAVNHLEASDDVALVVTVTDTGPGISEKSKDRIFEPFFTTKEPGTGTGLGLAVCKHLVGSFGGSIDARDGPEGKGAQFRVIIPKGG